MPSGAPAAVAPPQRQRYKVVVTGARGSGKTSLVRRLVTGNFTDAPLQRGLDFYTATIQLRDDLAVALQLWDLSDCPTAPDADPGPLTAYLYNCQAVLLLYDATDCASLEGLRHALAVVDAATADAARPYVALIASKCDLRSAASDALARDLSARHGCVRFALSARSGEGVARCALQLACDLAGVPFSALSVENTRLLEEAPEPSMGMGMGLGSSAEPWAEGDAAAAARGGGGLHGRGAAYRDGDGDAGQRSLPASATASRTGASSGGPQAWRPVSRSTTPSPTAMLISKAGPLGKRTVHARGAASVAHDSSHAAPQQQQQQQQREGASRDGEGPDAAQHSQQERQQQEQRAAGLQPYSSSAEVEEPRPFSRWSCCCVC